MDCCNGCKLEKHLGRLGIQRLECILVFKFILGSIMIVVRWTGSHGEVLDVFREHLA